MRRKVLRQTDEDILEQDMLIEKEIANGTLPDPNAPMELPDEGGAPGGAPAPSADAMSAPASPKEPEIETPKGGEI